MLRTVWYSPSENFSFVKIDAKPVGQFDIDDMLELVNVTV